MSSVDVKNLVVTRAGYPALADGTFSLPDHHFTLVTGANGSGKTTLLKAISGVIGADRGQVSCDGITEHRELRSHVAYVGHTPLYMRHISVREHIALCSALDNNSSASTDEILDRFVLSKKANVRVENLSAGQQRRLHLASAFARSTQLICVDEPHASLDDASKTLIDTLLKEQFISGRSFIVATHDPSRLTDVATQHIALESGCARLVGAQ